MGPEENVKALFVGIRNQVDNVKKAIDSKNLSAILSASRELVRHAVLIMEDIAKAMEAAGEKMTGADKHAVVANAVKSVVTERINKAIDIPFLSEDREAILINGVIDMLIKKAVEGFKKTGWQIAS